MRSYTANTEPIRIRINDMEFELLKADGVAQAQIMQYLAELAPLKLGDPEQAERALRMGCNILDEILGSGASFRIFGNTPVSFGRLMPLMMQIARDCAREYRAYIKNEYLEGVK